MPELRIILLIAGAVLIAGLWVWERRRNPAARPAAADPPPPQGATQAALQAQADTRDVPAVARATPRVAREAPPELPIIQIDGPGEIDTSFARATHAATVDDLPAPLVRATPGEMRDGIGEAIGEAIGDDTGDEVGPVVESPAVAPAWSAAAAQPLTGDELVLDWPPESQRQIVALRVVPRGAERFAGRSVRQALAGEGFVHGPMGIFHLPRDDGRVLMSAASLTRPGNFQLDAMDTGRYAGLNVFAVLPGALPADEIFDRLIEASRSLAARLNAELRDQQGEPLTTGRVVALRAGLVDPGP